MTRAIESFFRSPYSVRDKYLARVFSLFSEQVVRTWCACPDGVYEDLGRPTLRDSNQTRGHTIDFTLRRRDNGKTYVAELKCELEYDGYRYLLLTSADQLRHHTSIAFAKFLRAAKDPTAFEIYCKRQRVLVDGAILIWGSVAPEGRDSAMKEHNFADVLSIDSMLADLHTWTPNGWAELVSRHHNWTDELFDFMIGSQPPIAGQKAE